MQLIAYSRNSERARALLLRKYNAFDVFVEDIASQNVYVRMINRILAGRAQISHVFPLGGRDKVLETCAADQAGRDRRRIYLIDADFDLLLDKRLPNLRFLHRISAYCMENLLLSETAILEIAMECHVNATKDSLATLLQTDSYLQGAANTLSPLFVVYAACSHLKLGIETSSYSVMRLLELPSDPHSLSDARINARIGGCFEGWLSKGVERRTAQSETG